MRNKNFEIRFYEPNGDCLLHSFSDSLQNAWKFAYGRMRGRRAFLREYHKHEYYSFDILDLRSGNAVLSGVLSDTFRTIHLLDWRCMNTVVV